MKKCKAYTILFVAGLIIVALSKAQEQHLAYRGDAQINSSQQFNTLMTGMPNLVLPANETSTTNSSNRVQTQSLVKDELHGAITNHQLVVESDKTMAKASIVPLNELMNAPAPIKYKQTFLLPANTYNFPIGDDPNYNPDRKYMDALVWENNHAIIKKKNRHTKTSRKKFSARDPSKRGGDRVSSKSNRYTTA